MSRNIKVQKCIISVFTNKNKSFSRVKAQILFANDKDLSILLSDKRATVDFTFLKYKSVSKQVLSLSEKLTHNFSVSSAQNLESLLTNLK